MYVASKIFIGQHDIQTGSDWTGGVARSEYGGVSHPGAVPVSLLDQLTVETLPAVMEFRVCEFTTKLRDSLSCLLDPSLAPSRSFLLILITLCHLSWNSMLFSSSC